MSNSGWDVLDRAHQVLRAAVAGVDAAQWDQPTPCSDWTVTQVLQHAVGDQQAYAGSLTGTGFPEENPFAPSGALTFDALTFVEQGLGSSAAAFSSVAVDDPSVPVPLPQGLLAAPIAVGAAALDAAVHGWDIAVATGQRSLLADDLSAQLLDVAKEIVEPLRAFAFAPAFDDAPAESATASLLRFLGRDPRWQPTA
jgi:uncharacterized protein (TIGR03086 family)